MYQDYFNEAEWESIRALAHSQETPFLVISLPRIQRKFEEFRQSFPFARIFYAVKSNPSVEVLTLLRDLGSEFDVASVYELDKLLALNVSPERISYGNPIKKARHIQYAYDKGARLFTTDSEADIRNLAEFAPGSKIFFRVLMEAMTADWPLSRKFGCQPRMITELASLARDLGLIPYGVSFHVGSQQREISAWDAAIAKANYLFEWMEEEHIHFQSLNMGGGFPARYLTETNPLSVYAEEINRYLTLHFSGDVPEIVLEPGRGMVGDAGVIVSEVVMISQKSKTDLKRWVFTDTGKFNGLIETINESIKYPIYTEREGEEGDVILAGPTCDSQDIMYEDYLYSLPLDLRAGDRLYWLATGAYTSSYCSVEFNGFPPMKTYYI